MDRVRALVDKLREDLHQNADISSLKLTAQQLLAALEERAIIKPLPEQIYMEAPAEPGSSPEVIPAPYEIAASLPTPVKEVIDHIVLEPIKDLRSAIGINDKFQFIQALFGGDEKSFEAGIKTINSFKIFPEAQFYIKRELREKNSWDEESPVVKSFDQLVKRRFS
jgi:hypothetical protein